ncbi:putative ribosomal protein L2, domain 2 [Dioscorea sansibarensis]
MAVKGKGKEVAGKAPMPSPSTSSSGKRLAAAGSNLHRKKRRRSGVLQFFDESAVDAGCDDAESDDDGADDNVDRDFIEDEAIEPGDLKGTGKAHQLPFLVKEEELSGDELEELIKDRYGRDSKYVVHEGDAKVFDDVSQTHDMKDPNIWRVKCMVGRERQITFSLMQKFIDLHNFGSRLQIVSVFTLDHVKGYVYIEADKAYDVSEACKGFMNLYPSRIGAVARNEVPQLLSIQNKSFEVVENAWVRLKNGKYKGDLAQVVAVEAGQKRATIKLVPRIDLQAMSKKFGGGISLKEAEIPSPRLINAVELEDFRPHIQVRRDRQTGEEFDVLDGLMLKDGFVYKKVSIGSLVCWGVKPSKSELLQFGESNKDEHEDLGWISSVYSGQQKIKVVEASHQKSDDKLGNGYKLFDLVLFGRRDFGVIVALENESYQILKGGMGIPEVVTVKQQEIKNICVDKMFTASDRGKKTICMNDVVKVLEGPLEGKQGDVRHMYKGTLFIYDDLQTENSGLFCVKSELCEKIMELKSSSGGKKGGKSSSSFAPSAPTTLDGDEDNGNLLSRPRQKMREQTYAIGQTLRIRKGPLKGYLCRVVGVYRSDVTVKLDSLAKVLTVNENLLSLANLKRDEPAAASFDHFGAQDRKDADQEHGASLWDSKGIFGSVSGAGDSSRDVNCWDKSTGPSGEQNISWNKNIENTADDANDDCWVKALVKKECSTSNAWEKDKHPTDAGGSWGTEGFEKANESVTLDNQTSNWDKPRTTAGSVDGWGVVSDKEQVVSLEEGSSWTRTAAEVGNEKNDSWDTKGKCTGRNEEDAWAKVGSHGNAVDDSKSWGRSNDGPSRSKTIDSTFLGVNQSGNWDKAAACKIASAASDGMGSWNQAKPSSGNQPEKSNKGKNESKWESGGWDRAGISTKGQTDGWNESKSSDHAAGWDTVKGPSACQSDNWVKVEVPIAGERVGWEKAGSSSQIDTDGWNESKSFGGHQLSSWDKAKHPIHGHSESWGKAKNVGGDESSGWSKAGASGQVQPDGWSKPKSSFGDQASSWNNDANNHGQSGSWGKAKNVNEDESGGWNKAGALSGQVQQDGWSKPKSGHGDQVSSWNNEHNKESGRNNENSWEKAKSFEVGGLGCGGGKGPNVNWGNWENKSSSSGEGGSSWGGGRGGNGDFGRGKDEGNKWNQPRDSAPGWGKDEGNQWSQPRDSGPSWGRGRGQFGGRGNRDQNDSWNAAGESEGSWRPGGGRGRGRNAGNNDDIAVGRSWGRGRGSGSGRFYSSGLKNDEDKFNGNSAGSSWTNNQYGGWDKSKADGQSEVAGGSSSRQCRWNGGNSAGSSWDNNDQYGGWDKPKTDFKIETAGGSRSQQGGWDGGKSAGSSWDKIQICSLDKAKADGRSEAAGGSSSHRGGWDGGNSSSRNDSSGWNSSSQAAKNHSNWIKDASFGEEAGKFSSWNNNKNEAQKTPTIDKGCSSWDKPAGNWGNAKDSDGDKGGCG